MVRSSYKNRKKNQKQSFKRRITGGNRKVKFIEDDDDKMVGGDENQMAIAKYIGKYENEHPTLFAVLFGIYSNHQAADLEANSENCREDNMCVLDAAIAKSNNIMKNVPDSLDKPKALTGKIKKRHQTKYVGEVIDYLAQNVFIPKGLIKNIHVQKDDDSWTTLKNTNFKKVELKTLPARNTRNKYPVNDDKVYSESEITTIGKIVANLEAPDKDEEISENIEDLKTLVHKPTDAMGSDDFEKVVQTLTVANIKTTNLTEAFTKWKVDVLSVIKAPRGEEEEEEQEFADDSLALEGALKTGQQSLNIRKEKKQGKSAFRTGVGKFAPTRHRQLNKDQLEKAFTAVEERREKINEIAKKKGGDVVEMKALIFDLLYPLRDIMNSSVVEQDKQRLRVRIKAYDDILKQDNFEEMSTRWNNVEQTMNEKP